MGLDAFGSDQRPQPEIEAALAAAASGLDIDLVGDRAVLEPELATRGSGSKRVCVVHAAEQIAMDESPVRAVRSKPDASLCVAVDRLARGEIDALVSAGNSGAILTAALLRLGRLPGVDRPAIATKFPWADRATGHTVLLDVGANIECKALNLIQFAVIGAAYSRIESGVARPRVAVLANGTEAVKGTALTRATHEILSSWTPDDPGFEYLGYIEPGALFSSTCDVAVTDGWTGNVALKLAEGAMSAWPRMLARTLEAGGDQDPTNGAAMIAAALQGVARRVDPDVHGGAPLLGVAGPVMICHGAAGQRAILSALLEARDYAERGLTEAIGEALASHAQLFELARNRT